MGAYAGEVTAMHPQFAHKSSARALDMDLADLVPMLARITSQPAFSMVSPLNLVVLFYPLRLTQLYRLLGSALGTWRSSPLPPPLTLTDMRLATL